MNFNPVLLDTLYPDGVYKATSAPVVVLDRPWEKASNEERVLLGKILTAIRHSPESVTIQWQPALDLSQWKAKPAKLIYFGKTVKGIPLYEVITVHGTTLVAAEELSALLQQEGARKKLWTALKTMFLP